jgi:hypothetical protein
MNARASLDPKGTVTNGVARSAGGWAQTGSRPPNRFPPYGSPHGRKGNRLMRKAVPDAMFSDSERSRLSMLRTWVLDNKVTEIEMNETQFWNFAQLQPPAEKPWATFMGRLICVPDMPIDAQKHLGIFDRRTLGAI